MLYSPEERFKAREILLKISSDKIQQHVSYFFAYIAVLYSIYQIYPDNIILKSDIIFPFISIWLLVFLFGRFLYWSDFNSYAMIVAPSEIKTNDVRLDKNAIWAIQNGVGDRIMSRNEWKGEKRPPKFIIFFSSSFKNRKTSIIYSLLITLIFSTMIYLTNYTLLILS